MQYIIVGLIVQHVHDPPAIRANNTGGDLSGGASKNVARHTTSVSLYSDLAGMDSVCTIVPFSLTKSVTTPGNCPL